MASVNSSVSSLENLCNVSYKDSKQFLIVMYSSVCVLGLPINCITVWLSLLQIRQGNVLAVYLCFLAICELFYVATLPLWIIYINNDHVWTMGFQTCKITAFVFFCNIYISISFSCCISCERFIVVTYALEYRRYRLIKTAVFISIAIFFIVGLAHYPVFKMKEKNNTACFEAIPIDSETANYYYSRFIVGFAIPLSIIIFTNYKIIRIIKISTSLSAYQKTKVKYLAISIIAIFLVCFAPYHLVLLVRAVAFSYYKEKVCPFEVKVYTISVSFLSLSTFNCIADSIIYVFASENCRRELSHIHKRQKKWSTKIESIPM